MPPNDTENIGGISVSIGASHAELVAKVAEANKLLDTLEKRAVTVQIGANVSVPGGVAARPAPAPAVRYGAAATTGAVVGAAQPTMLRAINAELAKTGESYDAITGEITKATTATRSQRSAIIAVQQTAAEPSKVAIDFASAQNDAQSLLGTMRETLGVMREIASIAPRVGTAAAAAPVAGAGRGGGGAASTSTTLTSRDRAVNTDLANRVTRGVDTTLQRLSNEAQAETVEGPASPSFVPPLSQADRAALIERGTVRPNPERVPTGTRPVVQPQTAADAVEERRQRLLDDLNLRTRGVGGARGGGLSEEDILRREEERIATAASSRIAAGRTPRTTAAGIGGFALFGGPAREQQEAVARQAAAEQNLVRVRRLLNDPRIIRDARAFRAATEEETVAENELAKATESVNRLSSAGTALRSLGAVTVAGAAFSIGMKIAGVAADAFGQALGNIIDIGTGFSATSSRVTQALGSQTLALHGNVVQAIAASEAQAGLSAEAAKGVDVQLQLATQIKAGAQAAAQQQDLIRAALGAGQGTAPQGLLGGYGGLFNTSFLAAQMGGQTQGVAETIQKTFEDITTSVRTAGSGRVGINNRTFPGQAPNAEQAALIDATQKSLNDAAVRGAKALGVTSDAVVHFGRITASQATEINNSNLPQQLKDMAYKSSEAIFDASGNLVLAYDRAIKGLEQVAVGQGIAPVEQIARANLAAEQQRQREAAANLPTIQAQQAYILPSQIAAIGRNLNYQLGTQQPTQQAVSLLAQPNVPVGTGITKEDQARVTAFLKDAQSEQDQINARIAQGQQIIKNTYDPAILKNFGAAAQSTFDTAFGQVVNLGKEIAQVQAGISNEQAAYQAAQYNFQLFIAKRNLSDISGLIDKNLGYGESQYGLLERSNLLLGRQGQLLQFELSQRQINLQVAKAGFVVPGVTPEERAANVKEAQIEASYAQRQLDIQRQMFGNQVKIVDIGNLRQGADLLKQIGLLQQGRQVTIDTAAAEQKLLRLNQLQSQEVAKVTSFLTAVDNLTSVAFGNIQTLEAAAGHAMARVATDVLAQFGIFITGLNSYVNGIDQQTYGQNYVGGGGKRGYAGGVVMNISGPTRIGDNAIAGEAAGETLLVLAHPRAVGSGMGGVTNVINFNAPINVRSQNDIDEIARRVITAMGKQASLQGLRSVG